jgi:AraC-like DNA-binding protein
MLTHQDVALSNCRLFASSDLDETRLRISEIMQPHELRPVGPMRGFQAHMDFLRLPGSGVGTIKFGHMRVDVGHIADYHLLIFCLRGQALLESAGGQRVANAERGVYLAPAHPFRGEFSEDCEQLVIRIDAATMRKHTGRHGAVLNGALDLRRPALQPWFRMLDSIVHEPETVAMLSRDPAIAASYERLFIDMLLSGQGLPPDEGGRGLAPASVRKAETFIEANADRPICLEEIARAAAVPSRTLLNSFRRFRRTSPMRHLRDVRLERARARLSRYELGTTVAAVALDVGFAHLGRFSQDYAARFGEKPSETLERARRAN